MTHCIWIWKIFNVFYSCICGNVGMNNSTNVLAFISQLLEKYSVIYFLFTKHYHWALSPITNNIDFFKWQNFPFKLVWKMTNIPILWFWSTSKSLITEARWADSEEQSNQGKYVGPRVTSYLYALSKYKCFHSRITLPKFVGSQLMKILAHTKFHVNVDIYVCWQSGSRP